MDSSPQPADAGSSKRAQGRPARGENEVGSQKIVEGMRIALRTQRNTNVARKDIARHAGVTPALVTYYFPERSSLIEAATLPVVQALVERVRACLERDDTMRANLVRAVEVLLDAYARDAVVIALFEDHREATPGSALPDLAKELDGCLKAFFDRWLLQNPGGLYDADFLQKALVGTCKCITQPDCQASDPAVDDDRHTTAERVCCLLLGPVSAHRSSGVATAVGFDGVAL